MKEYIDQKFVELRAELIKIIEDNEKVASAALNDLNSRIGQ